MLRLRIMALAAAVTAVLALPQAALADHGKAGLWQITVSVAVKGVDYVQTVMNQHCMTPQEVAGDSLASLPNSGCAMKNTSDDGDTLSGDMVCTGNMTGTGHMAITYDAPTHYSGKMTFVGTAPNGRALDFTQNMEGRWVSASCGNVTK
jgi:Protein of unknown function (DUF3617)